LKRVWIDWGIVGITISNSSNEIIYENAISKLHCFIMGPAADSIPVRVPSSYVFCLSEHAKDDTDGRLSMWRGYGGNGSGAAIVFDTAKIAAREEMSLVIRHVHYGTAQDSQLLPLGLGITLFAREKALVAVKADAGKRREGSLPTKIVTLKVRL
jgi:hypothetical protein